MIRYGVPHDRIADPFRTDAEKTAILMLEQAAADEGGYKFEADEFAIGPDRFLRFRYFSPKRADLTGGHLGALSARYESGGEGSRAVSPGVIGKGENQRPDPGGVSYGTFQMTSRTKGEPPGTIHKFLAANEGAPFVRRLSGEPGSPEFSASWVALAEEQPEELLAAELAHIERTHYRPQVDKIAKETPFFLQIPERSRALQECVFSTAVHHGPYSPLVVNAVGLVHRTGRPAKGDAFDAALIAAVYDARAKTAPALRGRFDLERLDAERLLGGEEESGLAGAFARDAGAATSTRFRVPPEPPKNRLFAAFFEANVGRLPNFTSDEFLVLGSAHASNRLNTEPPQHLWPNVVALAFVLQRLRATVQAPIVLTSVYRSPTYNHAIGGVYNSQHMEFCAADFVVPGLQRQEYAARLLRQMRAERVFLGGVGTYAQFVHVDTRGYEADWCG